MWTLLVSWASALQLWYTATKTGGKDAEEDGGEDEGEEGEDKGEDGPLLGRVLLLVCLSSQEL